jgi:hypothetical protein
MICREALSKNFSEDRSYTDWVPVLRTALDYRFDNKLSLQSGDTLLIVDAASMLSSVLSLVPIPAVFLNAEAFFKPIYF